MRPRHPSSPTDTQSGFRQFGLRDELTRALDEAGYDSPTPIQEKAIPILLDGADLIGMAETGTGKTLAFLLPIFHGLATGEEGPQAIVICPTRELALQVAGEAERFGRHIGLRSVVVYGGTSSGDQKRALAAGVDLVVGTPGRMLDFLNSAWLSLRRVRTVVLDEADRMLDMGFINDVDAILRKTPMSRQTLLFSATVPEEIKRLAERYMFHPETIRMHQGTRVTKTVDHALYPVREEQKDALLIEILRRDPPAKALLFTATREGTSRLGLALRRQQYEVVSLSSLLSQANRERALAAFRSGVFKFLVATDVAARGLDITDIDLVVNYDVPGQAEDYVHRIGRTGRMERVGRAVTLVSGADERRVAEIERLLGGKIPRVELEGFPYQERKPPPPPKSGRGRSRPGRGGRRTSTGGDAGAAGKRRPSGGRKRRAGGSGS